MVSNSIVGFKKLQKPMFLLVVKNKEGPVETSQYKMGKLLRAAHHLT
jgi:hypothetical protein